MTATLPPPLPADMERPIKQRRILAVVLFIIISVPCVFCTLFIQPFKVPTGTMAPTIMPHSCVLTEKLTYKRRPPHRGEIIVFKTDELPIHGLSRSTKYIKRVAGIPGDRIRISPPNLIINGQPLKEPSIFAVISSSRNGYSGFEPAPPGYPDAFLTSPTNEVVLGKGEYFVLGDNTKNSLDSRYWGPVPEGNIIGRVVALYWPPDRMGSVNRPHK